MKPLIKWPGGKGREISQVYGLIPEFQRYIEPFFGGGAMYFHLQPKQAAINDMAHDLMEFYHMVRTQNQEFQACIRSYAAGFHGVLELGRATYSMNLIDGVQGEFADLFTGFHRFYDALIMNLVCFLAVFGGFVLFVIPGVMLSYAYAMAPYILAENPDISGVEALRMSRLMMKGHKWELFWLELTFIGWSILAAFVPLIGGAVVETYKGISRTSFYRDIQNQNRWNTVENF